MVYRTVPKFIKRHQHGASVDHSSLYKNKLVFGVSLKVNNERHGQSLPPAIIHLMKYLRKYSTRSVGLFRKSGSRLRINLMRDLIERTAALNLDEFEQQLNSLVHMAQTELNSCGSGFSSQSTSKSDLLGAADPAATNSAATAAAAAAASGAGDLLTSGGGGGGGGGGVPARPEVNIDMMCIDLADLLKQYFRELPECLFTNKLSQTLIDIFTCI